MDNELFPYSAITQRPPIQWPDGARVGIWRMIESLDRHGTRASVLLNSHVCARYPANIEAGRERDWAWLAPGKDNSTFEAAMTPEKETAYLAEVVFTIEAAVGRRPRGWLGPAVTETFETPRILAELGLQYVLDWCNDDQPYTRSVPGMMSVPRSIELNDVTLFDSKSCTGSDFLQTVVDQLDQLCADSEDSGRVMALCLHPFIINQQFRHRYLDQALEYIADPKGVWLATSDESAEHYRQHHLDHPVQPDRSDDVAAGAEGGQ